MRRSKEGSHQSWGSRQVSLILCLSLQGGTLCFVCSDEGHLGMLSDPNIQ